MMQLQNTAITFRQVCQSKHPGVTDVDASTVSKGIFAETREFKCYLSCLLDIMQLARKGKINYEKASNQLQTMLPDDLKQDALLALAACKDVAREIRDHCEASLMLVRCFYENNPHFVFP
uniref:Uncharacterized protein n=2 Tax=Anopheles albimanus TaxID=7167 RepID=A0A182FQ67_ANOAL